MEEEFDAFDAFDDLDACVSNIEGFACGGVDVSAQEDDCAGGGMQNLAYEVFCYLMDTI